MLFARAYQHSFDATPEAALIKALDAAVYDWSSDAEFACDYEFRQFISSSDSGSETTLIAGSHIDIAKGFFAKQGNNLILKTQCLSEPDYSPATQSASFFSETVAVFKDLGFRYTPFQTTSSNYKFGGRLQVFKRSAQSRYCHGVISLWFPFYIMGGSAKDHFSGNLRDQMKVAFAGQGEAVMDLSFRDQQDKPIVNYRFQNFDGVPLLVSEITSNSKIQIGGMTQIGKTWFPTELKAVDQIELESGVGYIHRSWKANNLRLPMANDFLVGLKEGVIVSDSASFEMVGESTVDLKSIVYEAGNRIEIVDPKSSLSEKDLFEPKVQQSWLNLLGGGLLIAIGFFFLAWFGFAKRRNFLNEHESTNGGRVLFLLCTIVPIFGAGCDNVSNIGPGRQDFKVPPKNDFSGFDSVDPTVYDFGVQLLSFDGEPKNCEISKTFQYTNNFTTPVKLIPVGTTCGCAKIEIDSSIVPPGGTKDILVTISPPLHQGLVFQKAFVRVAQLDNFEKVNELAFELEGQVYPSIDFNGVSKVLLDAEDEFELVVNSFGFNSAPDLTFEHPAFVSLEWSKINLLERMGASVDCESYKLKIRKLRSPRLEEARWLTITNSLKEKRSMPVFVNSPVRLSKEQLFFEHGNQEWKEVVVLGIGVDEMPRLEFNAALLNVKLNRDEKNRPLLLVQRAQGVGNVFATEIKIFSQTDEEMCNLQVASF